MVERDTEACSAEGEPRNSLGGRSEQIRGILSSRCHLRVILLSTDVAHVVASLAVDARRGSMLRPERVSPTLRLTIGKRRDGLT
jgi:hypothetical protein